MTYLLNCENMTRDSPKLHWIITKNSQSRTIFKNYSDSRNLQAFFCQREFSFPQLAHFPLKACQVQIKTTRRSKIYLLHLIVIFNLFAFIETRHAKNRMRYRQSLGRLRCSVLTDSLVYLKSWCGDNGNVGSALWSTT